MADISSGQNLKEIRFLWSLSWSKLRKTPLKSKGMTGNDEFVLWSNSWSYGLKALLLPDFGRIFAE